MATPGLRFKVQRFRGSRFKVQGFKVQRFKGSKVQRFWVRGFRGSARPPAKKQPVKSEKETSGADTDIDHCWVSNSAKTPVKM